MEKDNPPAKPVGRPRKTAIAAKKKRETRGRPKGDAAIINDYKARMLNSPKSRKVLDSIFEAALNDEHKHQAAAWKLLLDRIAPLSAFEQDIKRAGGKTGITINITGIGGDVSVGSDPLEADYEEVQDAE